MSKTYEYVQERAQERIRTFYSCFFVTVDFYLLDLRQQFRVVVCQSGKIRGPGPNIKFFQHDIVSVVSFVYRNVAVLICQITKGDSIGRACLLTCCLKSGICWYSGSCLLVGAVLPALVRCTR